MMRDLDRSRLSLARWVSALLSLGLALAVAATSQERALAAEGGGVRRFAIIVGANDGGPERVALRYAISDARSFAAVLSQLGGVTAADALVLEDPDKQTLLAAVAGLNRRLRDASAGHHRTELVLYYSGHSDEYGLLLGGERLDYQALREALDALDADVRIAILDSCASGALLRKKGGARVAPFLVDDSSDVSGHAFLTSSSADEAAQESDRLGASFFTHHLVSGLRGAADISGDGRVTLNEAYQYAFQETLARTERTRSGPQHPNYDFDLTGSGDVVITELTQRSSLLRFRERLQARLFIRDEGGHLVAEVDKPAGRSVALGLEPGRYGVSYARGGFIWRREVSVAAGAQVALGATDFERAERVEAHRERGAWLPAGDALEEVETAWEIGRIEDYEPTSVVSARWSLLPLLSFSGRGDGQLVDGFAFGLLGDRVELVRGLQLSGLFGLVDEATAGAQISGAFNITGAWLSGAQISAGANIVGGDISGAQITGGLNIAGGWLQGLQLALGANIAGDVEGLQLAAGFNVAERVAGVQIALVNIASEVEGTQIGLVNIAGRVRGTSIALLPIVTEGGYNHVEIWGDSALPFNLGLRLGVPAFHWILSAGVSDLSGGERCALRLGAGLGSHVVAEPLYLDFDLTAHGLAGKGCDMSHFADDEALVQARVTLGLPLSDGLAVFLGAAANAELRLDDYDLRRPLLSSPSDALDPSWQSRLFPSLFAGVRLF